MTIIIIDKMLSNQRQNVKSCSVKEGHFRTHKFRCGKRVSAPKFTPILKFSSVHWRSPILIFFTKQEVSNVQKECYPALYLTHEPVY